jgi:hypothetical protein
MNKMILPQMGGKTKQNACAWKLLRGSSLQPQAEPARTLVVSCPIPE